MGWSTRSLPWPTSWPRPTTVTVNLLGWDQRALADAFAGVVPRLAALLRLLAWTDTEWGPVLVDSLGWIGARLRPDPDHAGWGLLLRAVVERVEIPANPADDLLCYVRGRYRSLLRSLGLCSLGAMTTVLLIRHGRTSANTAGVLAGRASGIGLDAAGAQQAADLASRLAGVHACGPLSLHHYAAAARRLRR